MLAGCDPLFEPLSPDDVCREAAYSIANRSYDCTGDAELANRRYRAFRETYACSVPLDGGGPHTPSFDLSCPQALLRLSCEEVRAFGDDLARWLLAAPPCPTHFIGPGLGGADAALADDAGEG
jgi:hypothetical protein